MSNPTAEPNSLTKRQASFWSTYQDLCLELKYLPSLRELVRAAGLSSSSTIHCHLKNLRALGYPAYTRGQSKNRDHREKVMLANARLRGDKCPEHSEVHSVYAELADLKKDYRSLRGKNKELLTELLEAKSKLRKVKSWIAQTDQLAGVDRAWPHEWSSDVSGRLDLMVAAGEVAADV